MSDSQAIIEWVHFEINDDLTEVYVMVRAEGDSPIGVQGVHHKTFPAKMNVIEILQSKEFMDYVLWPLDAPPFVYKHKEI